jgi:L-seryl-tRNA(Ser) seleniumtransferase
VSGIHSSTLRIDKLSLAALEATLQLYRDPDHARRAIPVLAMLDVDPTVLRARAERLASAGGGVVVESTGRVGGGALPLCELSGPVAALDPGPSGADLLARRLRAAEPSLLGRIQDERLLLDPRTLADAEVESAVRVIEAVLGGSGPSGRDEDVSAPG